MTAICNSCNQELYYSRLRAQRLIDPVKRAETQAQEKDFGGHVNTRKGRWCVGAAGFRPAGEPEPPVENPEPRYTLQELRKPLQLEIYRLWEALASRQREGVQYLDEQYEPQFKVVEVETEEGLCVQPTERSVTFTAAMSKGSRKVRVGVHSDCLQRLVSVLEALQSPKPSLRIRRNRGSYTDFRFVSEPKSPEACLQLAEHLLTQALQLGKTEARFCIRWKVEP